MYNKYISFYDVQHYLVPYMPRSNICDVLLWIRINVHAFTFGEYNMAIMRATVFVHLCTMRIFLYISSIAINILFYVYSFNPIRLLHQT